jgi:chromosome segregation ATPase
VTDKENEKRAVQRAIDGFQKEIAHSKQRARDQKAEATSLRAKKHPERPLSNLPDLQSKAEELQGRLQHAREAKDQGEGIDREKGKERNDAKKRFDVLQGEMNRMQDNFNRLESVGKGSPLARFGNDVPKIAAAFREKEKVFPPGKAPIGPVGAFIKIKDPKWGLALCDATQGLRGGQTWLVHTLKDMETCKRILREKNIRENEAQFRTLNSDDLGDLKIGTASEPSILDVIEIDHPNQDCCRFIRNFLVDAYSINELRLADTLDAAKAVVARPIEACRFPNGVTHELKRICYSLDNAKTAVERVQTMSKSGGLKSKFVYSNMANPYEVDVSAQKAQVQKQLNEARQQYNEKKSAWEKVEADKRETMKTVVNAMKEITEIERHIKDLEGKIRSEEATQAKWKDVDKDEQDEEIKALEDTSAFDDEIAEKGRQIELKKQDIEALSNEIEELKEARSAVEQRKQEADDRKQQVSREVAGAVKALEELSEKLAGEHQAQEACRKAIENYELISKSKDVEIKKNEQKIEEIIKLIPARYNWQGYEPTERTANEIQKEISKLENSMKKVQVCIYTHDCMQHVS